MKALFFISISTLLLFGSCSSSESHAIKEFIPGTYIRSSKHEFGTEQDTLIISLQNKTANEYKIVRRWKYKRILDGKALEPEQKNTTTTAIFNENNKLLHETETGDMYSFDIKQRALFAGATKYLKQN